MESGVRRGYSIAALGVLIILLGASGCSGSGAARTDSGATTGTLTRAIERESRRPSARAIAAPLPPGLTAALAAPLDAAAVAEAELSLDEVANLDRFNDAAALGALDAPEATQPMSEEDQAEALRSYVLGRAARLAGDLKQADEELRRAASLDPSSSSVWREFAEVQLALGNRPLATSGFRRALAREPDSTRALEYLSGEAIERRDYEQAVAFLLRMRRHDRPDQDPALATIVSARLGGALLKLGYLAAGAQVLQEALDLPAIFGASTNFGAELTSVFRRRGSLWLETGDALSRLGRHDDALAAYNRAATVPGGRPTGVLARLVYADMRTGHPARAADRLLDQVRDDPSSLDAEVMDMLRYIVRNSTLGEAISRELSVMGRERAEGAAPGLARSLTIAGAAVADDTSALSQLRAYLKTAPTDESALHRLVTRAVGLGDRTLVEQFVALVQDSPLQIERYARVLVGEGRDPTALIAALGEEPFTGHREVPATLLRARLLAMMGQLEESAELLGPLAADHDTLVNAVSAGVLGGVLVQLGRYDEAAALAQGLDPAQGAAARLGRVLVLSQTNYEPDALDEITPLLDAPDDPMWSRATGTDVLTLGGQLHLALGQYESAAKLFEQVLKRDPARGDATAALLSLYGARRPLANERRVRTLIERMRAFDPDASVLRLLQAQDRMARRELDVAERELLSLAETFPARMSIIRPLVQLWLLTSQQDAAQQWLRAQWDRLPGESVYAKVLADVLVSVRRPGDAVKVLDEALAGLPGDSEVSVRLETLLRQTGQTERADKLLEVRLARGPRTPRVVFDLARLSRDQGDLEHMAELTVEMFEMSRPAPAEAVAWVEQQLEAMLRAVDQKLVDPQLVLRIQRALIADVRDVSFRAHLIGIQLLALTNAPVEEVIKAARAGASAQPDQAWKLFYQPAARWLDQSGGTIAEQIDHAHRAALIAQAGVEQGETERLRLLFVWVVAGSRMATLGGDWQPLVDGIELARGTGAYEDLLGEWATWQGKRAGTRLTLADAAADLANDLGRSDRTDLMESLYRDALKRDPTHLNANNNLGYQLLQAGTKLDDAVGMIETAFARAQKDFAQPEQRAFVTDSLGWSRYKAGILFNEVDEDGNVLREGAVPVLQRALDLARADAKVRPFQRPVIPVVCDHLADALWAAGKRDQAIAQWTAAVAESQEIEKTTRAQSGELADLILKEMLDSAEGAQEKIDAAKEDRQPKISRILRPVNQSPAPHAGDPTQ